MFENWVDGYGKFKTGEERECGLFEEKGEGNSDMPARRELKFLTFLGCC